MSKNNPHKGQVFEEWLRMEGLINDVDKECNEEIFKALMQKLDALFFTAQKGSYENKLLGALIDFISSYEQGNIKSFRELLDKEYGQRGTDTRDEFERGYEAYKKKDFDDSSG